MSLGRRPRRLAHPTPPAVYPNPNPNPNPDPNPIPNPKPNPKPNPNPNPNPNQAGSPHATGGDAAAAAETRALGTLDVFGAYAPLPARAAYTGGTTKVLGKGKLAVHEVMHGQGAP